MIDADGDGGCGTVDSGTVLYFCGEMSDAISIYCMEVLNSS